ncbi:MAG: chemotaxis protein CheX [Acidobacteriota bacterium]
MSDEKTEAITRAIQQVFKSMLRLELVGANGHGLPDFPPGRRVSAAVGISGDWNGAVIFECGAPTACFLTATMLGQEPPETVDEVVKDVIGEITNMVAGNFKNSLPGNSSLTLPCLIEGSDYSMDIVQGRRVVSQPLICGGRGILLSVVQANTQPRRS